MSAWEGEEVRQTHTHTHTETASESEERERKEGRGGGGARERLGKKEGERDRPKPWEDRKTPEYKDTLTTVLVVIISNVYSHGGQGVRSRVKTLTPSVH